MIMEEVHVDLLNDTEDDDEAEQEEEEQRPAKKARTETSLSPHPASLQPSSGEAAPVQRRLLPPPKGDVFDSPTLSLYYYQPSSSPRTSRFSAAAPRPASSGAAADNSDSDDDTMMTMVRMLEEKMEVMAPATGTITTTTTTPTSTCFWVAGVGFSIHTHHLDTFLDGEHFLARIASRALNDGVLEGTPLEAYVDVAAIALQHPNIARHVQIDEHGGSFFANAYFMPVIFDFIVRRCKAKAQERADNAAPQLLQDSSSLCYIYELPNRSDDALALDTLQDYLFAGTVFRSPLVLPDDTRYAVIALLPDNVKCRAHRDPASRKTKRTQMNRSYNPYMLLKFESMCFDPVWVDVVKYMQARVQYRAQNPQDRSSLDDALASGVVLGRDRISPLSLPDAFTYLCKTYYAFSGESKFFLRKAALDAKLTKVERGVAVRVETYALEAEPGARDGPEDQGWNIGTGYRLVERKHAMAKIEARLAVARMSATPAAIRRIKQIEYELEIVRDRTEWFVL